MIIKEWTKLKQESRNAAQAILNYAALKDDKLTYQDLKKLGDIIERKCFPTKRIKK